MSRDSIQDTSPECAPRLSGKKQWPINGILLVVIGTVLFVLTALFYPFAIQNIALHFELAWFLFIPASLILFVLGIYRLAFSAIARILTRKMGPIP